MNSHLWNQGLPRQDKDGQNWELFSEVLSAIPQGPQKKHMVETHEYVKKLLRLRYSSQLFRLATGDQVESRIIFNNTGPLQKPGVISMSIQDSCQFDDIDRSVEEFLILFNIGSEELDMAFDNRKFNLHGFSRDRTVSNGKVSIPARSLAVLVNPQEMDCP